MTVYPKWQDIAGCEYRMWHTRSGAGSRGSSEAGDNISTAEMEILQKRLIDKEKMLQDKRKLWN